MWRSTASAARTANDGATQQQVEQESTLSLLGLPLLAGVCLSAGVLLFGVGMGRWRNPRTHSEPGDVVVDPEAHDKMKHV